MWLSAKETEIRFFLGSDSIIMAYSKPVPLLINIYPWILTALRSSLKMNSTLSSTSCHFSQLAIDKRYSSEIRSLVPKRLTLTHLFSIRSVSKQSTTRGLFSTLTPELKSKMTLQWTHPRWWDSPRETSLKYIRKRRRRMELNCIKWIWLLSPSRTHSLRLREESNRLWTLSFKVRI